MENEKFNCQSGIGTNTDPLYGKQLAMVYSPVQQFRMLHEPEVALDRGTIFIELDKPLEEVC
jgi:hypothetical protein